MKNGAGPVTTGEVPKRALFDHYIASAKDIGGPQRLPETSIGIFLRKHMLKGFRASGRNRGQADTRFARS